jgi:hypothetical protein
MNKCIIIIIIIAFIQAGTGFADKLWLFGRYSSLVNSGHGV